MDGLCQLDDAIINLTTLFCVRHGGRWRGAARIRRRVRGRAKGLRRGSIVLAFRGGEARARSRRRSSGRGGAEAVRKPLVPRGTSQRQCPAGACGPPSRPRESVQFSVVIDRRGEKCARLRELTDAHRAAPTRRSQDLIGQRCRDGLAGVGHEAAAAGRRSRGHSVSTPDRTMLVQYMTRSCFLYRCPILATDPIATSTPIASFARQSSSRLHILRCLAASSGAIADSRTCAKSGRPVPSLLRSAISKTAELCLGRT